MLARILEREAHNALGRFRRDELYGQRAAWGEIRAFQTLDLADHLLRVFRAPRELDAAVQILGVLADYYHVHELISRLHPLVRPAGTEARVQVQLLAQSHVDAAKTSADRSGDRPLDGYLVTPNAFQHGLWQGSAGGLNLVRPSLLNLPVYSHACGVEHSPRGFGKLWPYAVTGYQSHFVGHVIRALLLVSRAVDDGRTLISAVGVAEVS